MPFHYAAYPQIPRRELRILWIHDYYDGVISGMLVYDGRLRWFECCNLSFDHQPRRFVIRDLNDEQVADEEKWHALFVEHVGDHWTMREDRERGTVKPVEEHARFYEPYSKRVPPDYSRQSILGWFEE